MKLLQEADAIFREEVANAGLERSVNQYFAVLTANRSVGVMGDGRTYGVTVALRAVTTTDFMTADWAHLPMICWAAPQPHHQRGGGRQPRGVRHHVQPPATQWE